MAFHKKYFILSLIVAYAILIGVYFWSKPHCSSETRCLRFCCNNTDTCSFDSVTKNIPSIYNVIFPADAVVHSEFLPKFISKSGEPSCELAHELTLSEWQIGEFGSLNILGLNFFNDEYCLQEPEPGAAWTAKFCEKQEGIRITFYSICVFISLFCLAATFMAYIFDKQLNNVPRRCLMLFVICLALLYVLPLFRFAKFKADDPEYLYEMFFTLAMITLLWMNVFAFDIWLTFKSSQTPSDSLVKFFFYCVYVFGGVALLLTMVQVFESERENILLCTAISLTLINLVLLHLAGFRISRILKASSTFDYPYFDAEVDRFWSYVQLFLIMGVTWTFEYFNFFQSYRTFDQTFVFGLLAILSSLSIFVIFVFHKRAPEDDDDYEDVEQTKISLKA